MSQPTLIVTPDELSGPRLMVRGDAYRHLFRSRRLAAGESLRLVDGRGRASSGRVESVGAREAVVAVGEATDPNEPAIELEIWAALPRSQRAAWLVEKVTEIGASAVRWLDSERSGRRPTATALERLERVAHAAVEQCGRSRVPAISGPHSWEELLETAGREPCWLLDPEGSSGSAAAVIRCHLIVGPEGGFSSAEVDALAGAGVSRVGLGRRRLRVETAAVAGATLLLAWQRADTARVGMV